MTSNGKRTDVNDRRLRLLYDSLDNNENKRTLQEADKLLKKTPNFHCAKALKALALVRLSRRAEADVLLAQLDLLEEYDENTIHALTACFKEIRDYKAIVRLHEKVCKGGADEEKLAHLFMAYLRVQDFSSLQKVAIKLHKLKPGNNNYAYWNISCYLLQAAKDPEKGDKLYLRMAQTWAGKCLKDVTSLPEAMLHLMVLQKQKKFQEVHDLLTSTFKDIVRKEDEVLYDQLLRKVLFRMKRWSLASQHATSFLALNPDDFLVFQYYFMATHHTWRTHLSTTLTTTHMENLFKLVASLIEESPIITAASGSSEGCLEWVAVVTFINTAITECKNNPLRAPHLAHLELLLLLKHASHKHPYRVIGAVEWKEEEEEEEEDGGDDEDLVEKTHELWHELLLPLYTRLLAQFACQFGSKPCCFGDLRRFLPHLPPSHTAQFLTSLRQAMAFEKEEEDEEGGKACNTHLITTEKEMWKHLLLTTIGHYFLHKFPSAAGGDDDDDARGRGGAGDDNDDDDDGKKEMGKSSYLLEYFKHALQFGSHLNSTEIQPADGYLLLRAQRLLNVHQRYGSVRALVEAMVELEEGLQTSTSSHHLKLHLVLFSCLLGGDTDKCQSLLTSMDIKHVQLDSIGFPFLNNYQLNGDVKTATSFHKTALQFYQSALHDLVNYIVMTFKSSNYHKTEELINFKHLFDHSLQFISSTLSSALLSITSSVHQFDSLKKHVLSLQDPFKDLALCQLVNNRDLDVACSYFMGDRESFKEEANKEELFWLLLQSRVLSFIGNTVQLTDNLLQQPQQSQQQQQQQPSLNNGHQEEDETTTRTPTTTTTNIKAGDFNVMACMLLNRREPLQNLDEIASAAEAFLRQRKHKFLFATPLKYFFSHHLHTSLSQFSHLFQAVTAVVDNPSLDASAQRTDLKDLQVHKISQSMQECQKWFLHDVETTQYHHLLVQHVAHLLVVVQCCSQLLAPYRGKKNKKKNKLGNVTTTLYNLDVHTYALSGLLNKLTRYFSHSSSSSHNQVAKNHLLEGQTSDKCLKTEAMIERLHSNHVRVNSEARDLVSRWSVFVQSIANTNFAPEVEEVVATIKEDLVI